MGSLVAQTAKNLPAMQKTQVQSLGREDPLEEEMAAHSSILAWEIPRTEEASRLQCVGLQSRAGRSTHKPNIRRSPKSLRQEVAEQGLAPRSFNC